MAWRGAEKVHRGHVKQDARLDNAMGFSLTPCDSFCSGIQVRRFMGRE